MSTNYLANSKNWFEQVAVKKFKYENQFLDETDALISLQHPGVPAFYGACRENHSHVMEHMESDLHELLQKDVANIRFLTFRDRLLIAAQVRIQSHKYYE